MDELPSNRMRILIVDDDQVTARDLEGTLKRRGFLVIGPAFSADEARTLARTEAPQLAILDIDMEQIDSGIELARELKEQFQTPVVFATGFSEDALFEKARDARPVGFLRKPFSDAELIVCLESILERGAAEQGLSLRLPGIEAVSNSLPHAVLVSDRDGKLHYLNAAAENLTDWGRSEAEGLSLDEVAPLLAKDDSPSEGSGKTRSVVLTTRTGEARSVEERTAPIKSEIGELVGLITLLFPENSRHDKTTAKSASSDPPPMPATPAQPEPDETGGEFNPPARSGALRNLAELSRDPAFRELIGNRETTAPGEPERPSPSGDVPTDTKSEDAETVLTAAGSPLADEVGDPILKIDKGGRITYANAEAISVFGGGNNLVGLMFWDRFSPSEFENYDKEFHRPLVEGRRHRFEFHDTTRGRWFDVRSYQTEQGILALFTDTTSGAIESAENVRQQRLEGLGLLARGFAHDFNNYLTTITGNISLARERQQEDAELQQMLNEAQTASSRATSLVQQLMTFAQGGRPIRKRTRISDLVRHILTEHRLQHPEVRYQFQGAETELVANVDPAQISRLIENLLANSVLAMSEGGVLIVRCARITAEEVLGIKESHNPAEEDHLLIEVIDTGHGMSEQALNRVFEPYFTTRRDDNATGIGLTVCESIAKAHGGFIQLQSKQGKGTIATFCAPLGHRPDQSGVTVSEGEQAEESSLRPIPIRRPQPRLEGEGDGILVGTRILILEDDAPIRRLMAATLRRAGHEVFETKDGRETVAVYREALENNAPFHLLICDLTIENGMGGVETMRQLTELDPSILAIVSSGYSDAPAMSSPASFGFSGVLPKPYAPSELRAAVHRILTAHHIIS